MLGLLERSRTEDDAMPVCVEDIVAARAPLLEAARPVLGFQLAEHLCAAELR